MWLKRRNEVKEKDLEKEEEEKLIFEFAKPIAAIHEVLTSPTGDFFRMNLLQKLRNPLSFKEIDEFRIESKLAETERHLDKLMRFNLIREINQGKRKAYIRTDLGKKFVNALKRLKSDVGQKPADKIFKASLGENSIRLFIKMYERKHTMFKKKLLKKKRRLEVSYTPFQIGMLSLFLPRNVAGLSAIDKLNLAGLLYYGNDECIHFPTVKARNFFKYLGVLLQVLPGGGKL